MSLRIKGLLLLFCTCLTLSLSAQGKPEPSGKLSKKAIEQLRTVEDTLGILAFAVVNDSIEAERFAACRALVQGLVRALKIENSYKYPFSRLKSLSILAPPDSSFRIFTWQLFVNDSTYRYYGAIQMNRRELQLFPLIDRSFEFNTFPTAERLTADKWYGALYYNLRQFDTPKGRHYLLTGYDAFEFFDKRKVLEVLSFDPQGVPVFGADVFDMTAQPMPIIPLRHHIEYSAEANCKLNWDELYQMILFDHLLTVPSPFGRDFTHVPDGSYDGFKWEKGRWKFVSKVFNDVMTEEFRPEPIPETQKGKNIAGKPKKKKGRY
jgi:hypothetical protein